MKIASLFILILVSLTSNINANDDFKLQFKTNVPITQTANIKAVTKYRGKTVTENAKIKIQIILTSDLDDVISNEPVEFLLTLKSGGSLRDIPLKCTYSNYNLKIKSGNEEIDNLIEEEEFDDFLMEFFFRDMFLLLGQPLTEGVKSNIDFDSDDPIYHYSYEVTETSDDSIVVEIHHPDENLSITDGGWTSKIKFNKENALIHEVHEKKDIKHGYEIKTIKSQYK